MGGLTPSEDGSGASSPAGPVRRVLGHRHSRRAAGLGWYLLAITVITLAVGVVLMRLLLPQLPRYQQDIEDWLSEAAGARVRIERIDARWRGLGPQLVVQGFRLIDPGSNLPFLSFREAEIRLDPLASMLGRSIEIGGVWLKGGQLTVIRDAEGGLSLSGIGRTDGGVAPDAGAALGWLMTRGGLGLLDTEVRVIDNSMGPKLEYRFEHVDLVFVNEGDRHAVRASVALPGVRGANAELTLRFTGPAKRPERWSGELHAALRDARLSELGSLAANPVAEIDSGTISGALWLRFDRGLAQDFHLRFKGEEIGLVGKATEVPRAARLVLDEAGGVIDGRRVDERWELTLSGLESRWRGRRSVPVNARASVAFDRGSRHLTAIAAVDQLSLADWSPWFEQLLPASGGAGEWLQRLSPRGRLNDWRLHYDGEWFDLQRLRAAGAFEDLGFDGAARGMPSVAGVDGAFTQVGDQSLVRIDTEDAELDFRGFFRYPMPVNRLDGELRMRMGPAGLSLSSGDLRLRNPDVEGVVRVAVDIDAPGQAFMDLRGHFRRANAVNTYRYLPVAVMGDNVVQWLDRSIRGGSGQDVDVLLHGRLSDFFDYESGGSGRFAVRFGVEDARLDYLESWPAVQARRGEVAFVNTGMFAELEDATVLDVAVQRAALRIPELRRAALRIDLRSDDDVGDHLAFIRASPLIEGLALLIADAQATGRGELDLRIDIPLSSKVADDEVRVEARLRTADAGLSSVQRDLEFTDVAGEFVFTERGVFAEGVEASYFGAPVRVDIDTPLRAGQPRTVVSLEGVLPTAVAARGLQSPLLDRVQGESLWEVELSITRAVDLRGPHVGLRAQSNLRGVAVDLPFPLGKTAAESRRLVVELGFRDESRDPVRLSWDDQLQAVLLVEGQGEDLSITRAAVDLDGGRPRLPLGDQWDLAGGIERFSLTEWGGVLGAAPGQAGARQAPLLSRLGVVNVGFDELEAFGFELGAARLVGPVDPGAALELRLSSDIADGKLLIPAASTPGRPYVGEFDRLRLVESDIEGPEQRLSPADWPPLRVKVGTLETATRTITDLRAEMTPEGQGLRLHLLSLEVEGLRLKLDGDWRVDGSGGYRSDFRIELESDDAGSALSSLGLAESMVGGRARVVAALQWPGDPLQFEWSQVNGTAELEVVEGSLQSVDPKAGRLLGLFSIDAIPSRLSLDFKDLFNKGFVYDSIEGNFSFVGSDVYTQDLTIKGRSARIELRGRTGIVAQDYDQVITVTPKLGIALPVAGVIVGGTGVGAAVLLLQQLLKPTIEEETQFQYTLTGSWEEPVMERVQEEEPASGAGVLQELD